MNFNLFLLLANPLLHVYLVYQNPCAPNFFSSLYFDCQTIFQDTVSVKEKFFFVLFEYHHVIKWQYLASFMWCCIYLAIWQVDYKLKQLRNGTIFFAGLRKCSIVVKLMNMYFYIYLLTFPMVGTAVVALLFYAIVRFWHLGPGAVMMFPLCATRCGFELLTPIAAAGTMSINYLNCQQKWKSSLLGLIKRKDVRLAKHLQKTFKPLRCTSGSVFSFGKLILLVILNVIINQTVSLLVSF